MGDNAIDASKWGGRRRRSSHIAGSIQEAIENGIDSLFGRRRRDRRRQYQVSDHYPQESCTLSGWTWELIGGWGTNLEQNFSGHYSSLQCLRKCVEWGLAADYFAHKAGLCTCFNAAAPTNGAVLTPSPGYRACDMDCFWRGAHCNEVKFWEGNRNSAVSCQMRCRQEPARCKGFTWYAKSGSCRLLSSSGGKCSGSDDDISGPPECPYPSSDPSQTPGWR